MICGPVFRRLSCLTFLCGCRFFRTVVIHIPYIMRTHNYTHTVTRAYCKLQKLLPLAKLISKYASWHLMPSVTEIRAKDPAGGLKFCVKEERKRVVLAQRCQELASAKSWLLATLPTIAKSWLLPRVGYCTRLAARCNLTAILTWQAIFESSCSIPWLASLL